ncbi:phosphate ABC transporter substrate-binding protein PstS [Synechococcus sp. WH 8016]|uniref:phosphate ABC transporter substrate-binding protein PstS n=1 Tax=Synechococcus sp. WH 8016 TaxID=166318 RepID=UPI00022D9BCA|nr:phosphate ABC transporter substrate-binding protein PstS [Synechococcus sp. WH 8016]EHA63630.1 phosphate ABC transporter, periplasmic phosphate-binding protein [Synechococcus sp. WH 8016]
MRRPFPIRSSITLMGVAAGLSLAACTSTENSKSNIEGTLSAAGASFPAAIYQRWFSDLAPQGIQVNYQSVGSGAGVRQFTAGTVDFGASDKPMKPEAIAKISRGVVQIPMTAGAIAVAYNNAGCELKLTQDQLAGIFLGSIKNYSELGCDSKAIKIVHRSDGSGTTYNFTKHLSAISPEWKDNVGADKSVQWPSGIGAKGNEGVSAQLQQIDGGIGYVELAYVKGDLQAAAVQNGSGEKVVPTNKTASEALGSIDLGPDLIGGNPNPMGGYPIVTFTWVLAYANNNAEKLPLLQKTFNYMLSDEAQSKAPELGYVSLPPEVISKAKEAVATIKE